MQNLKPKKHLGQHFLRDMNIARKIVSCCPAKPDERVVEIGPGPGVLTRLLLDRLTHLNVVEYDGEAVELLREEFDDPPLTVFHSDILQWDIPKALSGPAHFIGNLPYNVSSPIFFHLLDHIDLVETGVFMVQKEVADRILSGPGTKQFGILSVLMGAYFEMKYEFTVSRNVFFPKPKVTSAVFSVKRKAELPEIEFASFKQVVKAAFGQRRKTLRNALKAFSITNPELMPLLAQRAEQLHIDQYLQLAHHIAEQSADE